MPQENRSNSTPWFELYANLSDCLVSDDDRLCLSQSISFIKDNRNISVRELPTVYAFLWTIKSEQSIISHMNDDFASISPSDIIPFIVFNEALLARKGRIEMSKTRYISIFTVFQYLLGQRMRDMNGTNTRIGSNFKLFDFDSYDAVHSHLKGNRLPD
jgi:hypothetical protein